MNFFVIGAEVGHPVVFEGAFTVTLVCEGASTVTLDGGDGKERMMESKYG